MADIRQYFKPTTSNLESSLPTSVSKATILVVQKQLKARNTAEPTNNRGAYIKISAEERAKIGGYAAKNGVTAAIRHFR